MRAQGVSPTVATYSTLIGVGAEAGDWGRVLLAWGWLEAAGAAVHISCVNAYLTALIRTVGGWVGGCPQGCSVQHVSRTISLMPYPVLTSSYAHQIPAFAALYYL
jgi:hypothetical protein